MKTCTKPIQNLHPWQSWTRLQNIAEITIRSLLTSTNIKGSSSGETMSNNLVDFVITKTGEQIGEQLCRRKKRRECSQLGTCDNESYLVVKGRKGCILAMTRRTSGMRTASSATRSVGKNDSIHGWCLRYSRWLGTSSLLEKNMGNTQARSK